jgi:ABC-type branched-subunit amino acid transport system permease subunit
MNNSQIPASAPTRSVAGRKWTQIGIYAALIAIIAIIPLISHSEYILHILILTFIYTITTVSLRTITVSGQFPLAHGAFMGIGAYVAGMASKWLTWSPWFTIPAGAVVALGIGMLIGYPFARLRAMYYAMGSLFFGIGVVQIINTGGTITGGYSGITGIHPMFIGSRTPYYYFFLGLALVCILALYRFEFSRIGTGLKAISQSYLVASSVGINEAWYRILAVGVGCFFAGLAGAGYAHYNMVLTSGNFDMSATFLIVMYMLVGGIDSFIGPIIGTFVLVLIPEIFRGLKNYSPYLSAGIVLIVAYLMPQGLAGIPQLIRIWYRERKAGTGRPVRSD